MPSLRHGRHTTQPTSMMRVIRLLAVASLGASAVESFAPTRYAPGRVTSNYVSSRQALVPTDSVSDPAVVSSVSSFVGPLISGIFREVDPDQAKGEFWFQFVAGSGGLGIGIAQIPKIAADIGQIRDLANEGPTAGGETVNIGPLASLFYPAPSAADVNKVISKVPTAEAIVKQSTSTIYFAKMGYVVEEDFTKVLGKAGCNPLAIKTAFDALSGGKGSAVDPITFADKLGRWKEEGTGAFARDLQGAAVTKISSYGTLLFLVGLVGDLIIESGINGFLD
uniref:Uncharacterized protein n=1 Tax=Trieres chinensis TaxID=1514140 RepID=A0A7S1YWS5_TRICV